MDAYFPFLEDFFPVYEAIQARGLPILWHCGTYPYTSPLQLAYVALKFPEIPHILGHFALADLSWECFPAADLTANVYVDLPANPIIPLISVFIARCGARAVGIGRPLLSPGVRVAKGGSPYMHPG